MFEDDRGSTIDFGDTVAVTYVDRDRGAELWMTQAPGRVVGFGRTRVKVQFGWRNDVSSVGAEALRIVRKATTEEFERAVSAVIA